MSESTITLLARRKGDPQLVFDRHFQISAELGWLLKGPPEALDDAADALAGVCERISHNDVLLLTFGNAVGFFDVPGLGRIEVMSGKWSRVDFDQMLAELTDIAAGLPFSATNTAALPYDRSVAAQEDILYHMFVYIRHALSEESTGGDRLLPALRHVLRDPYRRFERNRRNVAIDQVRHLDSVALTAIATGTGGVHTNPSRSRGVRSARPISPGALAGPSGRTLLGVHGGHAREPIHQVIPREYERGHRPNA